MKRFLTVIDKFICSIGSTRIEALIARKRGASWDAMEYRSKALAEEILGPFGQMLSGSKVMYVRQFPDNVAIFNANVCTSKGKIWFGDLDVTKDQEKLRTLAEALGEKVYVLREHDGRFDNENSPKLEKAVWIAE